MASAGMASASLAAPTLEDFCSTCATVIDAAGCTSRIVYFAMVRLPGAVAITVCGVTRPLSSASATVKGLSVEPGSKRSVSTRLRSWAPESRARLFGLNEGTLAIASTSPERTSIAISAPALARWRSTALFSAP